MGKMMKNMGYSEGMTLGKEGNKKGLTEPLEAYSSNIKRGGLGFEHKIDIKQQKHCYEAEKTEIEISPSWYSLNDSIASKEAFESYLGTKRRCDTVGVEWDDTFCSIEIQKEVFSTKKNINIDELPWGHPERITFSDTMTEGFSEKYKNQKRSVMHRTW